MQAEATARTPTVAIAASFDIKIDPNNNIVAEQDAVFLGQTLNGRKLQDLFFSFEGDLHGVNLPSATHPRRWCFVNQDGQRIYAKAEALPSDNPEFKAIRITPNDSPLKHKDDLRVLIVDDEAFGRTMVLGRTLTAIHPEKSGKNTVHGVDIAVHGEDALLKVERVAFDIIIMDLHMTVEDESEINGFQTANRIREIEARLLRKPSAIILHSDDSRLYVGNLPPSLDDAMNKKPDTSVLKSYIERHWPAADH